MKNIYSHRKFGLFFKLNKSCKASFFNYNRLLLSNNRLFSTAKFDNLKPEELLTELKEKPVTTEEIFDLLQSKKHKLIAQHYNIIMTKTNRIYEDMLIRIQRATTQGEAFQESKITGNIPTHSSYIFKTALTDISKVIDTVSKTDVITWMSIIGKTKVKFDLDFNAMNILEEKVVSSISEYPLADLMALSWNFMNLNYIPNKLIEKINSEEKFVIVPSNTLKDFLQTLLNIKFISQPNLYVKIFEQLKLSSANMEGNEICQIFENIKEIYDLKILDNDNLKAIFYDDIIKFFSIKLIELYKRKIEPGNNSIITLLKNFESMGISNSEIEETIVAMMAARTSHSLSSVIECLRYLSNENKAKLIEIIISLLKDKKADIRSLKFNDLFLFMIEVIKNSEKDISHFFKYLEKIFQNEIDEKFDINIISELYYCAVEHGYISKSNTSQFLYHYLFQLCENYEKIRWK